MQIPYRGTFVALPTGIALAGGAAYPEQSTEIGQGFSKLQTTHWAGINSPTIVSTDVMEKRAVMDDAAVVKATVMKGA